MLLHSKEANFFIIGGIKLWEEWFQKINKKSLRSYLKKTQFLQDVTITGDVDTVSLVIDSDGISYFTISGFVIPTTSGETYIEITGIPNGLASASEYPATNDLGTSGYVTTTQVSDNVWKIMFNAGTAGRTVYFSVMLSQDIIGF